jgi:enediyne biosynthesis protein E4
VTGVTGALWTDVDDDGWLDLWVTRSWGSSSLWMNQQGRLVERTAESGLGERTGWWQGVIAGDFDADGDLDYIVGNRGLNTPYAATPERPCLAFTGALDGTGRIQMIEGMYEGERLVPVRSRAALTAAFPGLAARFATAAEFAAASLADFVGADVLRQARVWSVNTMESGLWRNLGGGTLTFEPLPRLAQIAPAFGAAAWDANGDGHLDVALVQNTAETALDLGRFHGGLGLLLAGDGQGQFRPVPLRESGWIIPGEGRSVALTDVNQDGFPDVLAGVCHEAPTLFTGAATRGRLVPVRVVLRGHPGNPAAVGARVRATWVNGRAQAAEIAAGQGCWSQGTAVLAFSHSASNAIARLEVRWPRGPVTQVLGPFPSIVRLDEPPP